MKFDFTLNAEERVLYVQQNLPENPSKNELAAIADYLVYARDSSGVSPVDRHEIIMEDKAGRYKGKTHESLESFVDEEGHSFEPQGIYKLGDAPKFSRKKPASPRKEDAPGIGEVDTTIQGILAVLGDLGEEDSDIENKSDVSAKERHSCATEDHAQALYRRRHFLIELRRERYYLKESHNPYICPLGGQAQRPAAGTMEPINWDEWLIRPMGLYVGDLARFRGKGPDKAAKWDFMRDDERVAAEFRGKVLDFCNPFHVYKMAECYTDLAIAAEQDGTSTAKAILDTLDFYVGLANLSEERLTIWNLKIAGASNEEILPALAKLGKHYRINYISTVFKQQICARIAEAARLNYEEYLNRGNDDMWKVCSKCGRRRLKDLRCFTRKSNSSDGYNSVCKDCEKKKRALGKFSNL